MILDLLGVGRLRVYPELFKLGPITVYTYGVLLAASYLLGLRLAMSRAKTLGPRCQSRARPRHLHHHRGARRREAAAAGRGLRSVPRNPGGAAVPRPIGRRVLRRVDPRRRGGVLVHRQAPHAVLDDVRRVCAGDRAGARHGPARDASPPAAATASRPTCRGRSSSPIRWPPPTSARRSAFRCTRRSCTRPAPSC